MSVATRLNPLHHPGPFPSIFWRMQAIPGTPGVALATTPSQGNQIVEEVDCRVLPSEAPQVIVPLSGIDTTSKKLTIRKKIFPRRLGSKWSYVYYTSVSITALVSRRNPMSAPMPLADVAISPGPPDQKEAVRRQIPSQR